jgi:hypothetical protein
MVFGVFTSSSAEERKTIYYPTLPMSEVFHFSLLCAYLLQREAIAVTFLILKKRVDQVISQKEGSGSEEHKSKRRKITWEEVITLIHNGITNGPETGAVG